MGVKAGNVILVFSGPNLNALGERRQILKCLNSRRFNLHISGYYNYDKNEFLFLIMNINSLV